MTNIIKLKLISSIIFFCGYNTYGQTAIQPNNIISKPDQVALTVGDLIPERLWSAPLNDISSKAAKTIMLNDFKGKPFILDFWASWCQPCLNNMPRLDSLSREKDKAFQAIMVNTRSRIDSLKNIKNFVREYISDKPSFHSPIVSYQPLLQNFFPHHVVPHYVWVGADGRVKAITDHNALTPKNIKTFVSGLDVDIVLKVR